MLTDTSDLLALGLISIIIGVFILISMVSELVSSNKRKWLLAIALGSGIIAFSLKIVLLVTLSALPIKALEKLPKENIEKTTIGYFPTAAKTKDKDTRIIGYTWKALPHRAPSPSDNPTTPEKVALGMMLFFDNRPSLDNSVSCASCHEISEEKGGGDGRGQSIGIYKQVGVRNAPTILNSAFQRVLFWDGRAHSLEEQAIAPMINPIEMGMPSVDAVEMRVRSIPEYQHSFRQVFPEQPSISIKNIAKAIAAYERTLITPNSPYDRFVNGDANALSKSQIRGMALFQTVGCIQCHSGPNFSGASIFGENSAFRIFPASANTTFESKYNLSEDLGLASQSGYEKRGIWRIPSLRNISRTAPYFHNGSVETLEEAVRIMANVQLNKKLSNSTADDSDIFWSTESKQMFVANNRALNDEEIKDIVAFLKSLNGDLSGAEKRGKSKKTNKL